MSQTDIAAAMGMQRTVLSAIENEHAPTNAEFTERYMALVHELTVVEGSAA